MEVDASGTRCAFCGTEAPDTARFCAQCGRPLAGDVTAVEAPRTVSYSERRLFGVAPPELTLGLAVLVLAAAIFSFASGDWPIGVVLLLVALGLGVLFLSISKRMPQGRLALLAVRVSDESRARAGFGWTSVSSWSSTGREAVRLKRRRRSLRLEQVELIRSLGEAVYAGEDEQAELLLAVAKARGEQIEQCDRDLTLALDTTRERLGRERRALAQTRVVNGPSDQGS